MLEIVNAINIAKSNSIQPSVIIAHTIPGKGWSDIVGDYHCTAKPRNKRRSRKGIEANTYYGR